MSTPPIEIVGYEEESNLIEITWNQKFLEAVHKEYNLKHREAVLYVNAAQDRFRLVACFYGLPVLVLPPTCPEERLSLYLKVSMFLKKFTTKYQDLTKALNSEIKQTTKRIERRDNRRRAEAKKALSRRRKAA